jgi:hypothetical protein
MLRYESDAQKQWNVATVSNLFLRQFKRSFHLINKTQETVKTFLLFSRINKILDMSWVNHFTDMLQQTSELP